MWLRLDKGALRWEEAVPPQRASRRQGLLGLTLLTLADAARAHSVTLDKVTRQVKCPGAVQRVGALKTLSGTLWLLSDGAWKPRSLSVSSPWA